MEYLIDLEKKSKRIQNLRKVKNLIPAEKENAITATALMGFTGLSFRALKEIITELRNDYPIVSKETDGGGYWVAENDKDIKDFIHMISRRKRGYDNTIEKMANFLEG